MKKRYLRSAALCLVALMMTVQMGVPAFAAEITFDDVPTESPWYESIHYIADQGITLGTGNNTFSPDAPITARQWAVMLCRAYGEEEALANTELPFGEACLTEAYRNGWLSLGAMIDPDVQYCRAAMYESVFSVINVPVYDYSLYDEGVPLSHNENNMRIATELGFCDEVVDPFEIITRGEAAFILHTMLTGQFEVEEPQVLRELPIKNYSSVNMNAFLLELRRVPEPILQRFQDKNWTYSVDFDYLADLSKSYGMTCIGATSYLARYIYVSEADATLHEFGHFLDGELGFPSRAKSLYQNEAANTTAFLRDYARKNHYEYFAEYFVYWLNNHDDPVRAAQMEELTPQTYQFFCEIAENNWGFTAH